MQRNVGTDETQRGHLNEHFADLTAALSKSARQLESQNDRFERFTQGQREIPSMLERIPDDFEWVLRVHGHTDSRARHSD